MESGEKMERQQKGMKKRMKSEQLPTVIFTENITVHQYRSGLEINGGPVARLYQKSCRTTNPSGPVGYQTLPADITFVSFCITLAVAVTATMLFVFDISTIVIYSFFIASGNTISNVSSNVYAE